MNTLVHKSFASVLFDSKPERSANEQLRALSRQALIPLAVALSMLALWGFTAPLSGAIIAAGKLKVELNRKTVQHQEGGLVRQILVHDGDFVHAGQPLIVIGDVRNDAELNLLQDRLDAERVRNARATAEANLLPKFDAPDTAARKSTLEHLTRERALFAARRRTLDEQLASFNTQMGDARQQASALAEQIDAMETSARLAHEESQLNQNLVRDGYVPRTRLLQLQRDEADYRSRQSETRSNLAVARQRIGELQARIAQTRNQYQQQATDEARESSTLIREFEERVRPSQDQAERQFVRAPVDGRIMSLRVSAIGEVIGPRDPILDIVPSLEKLVVEAHIRPQDINHVREQSAAEVRLSGFDSRTTPLLPGKVVFVSPDRLTASDSGESWFVATVEVDATALKDHPEILLQAGMPAELFVTTPKRTLFEYLAKPLNAFATRAMREP